jgi:phosphoinositide-3-kinase regulatory subunit 4
VEPSTAYVPAGDAAACYVVRPWHYTTLYDRLSTRPFLDAGERRWIAFQLLHAVASCHAQDVVHGDLKIDNVTLTSWHWALLVDFAPFKPTHMAADNPAAFSYFFDTSGRRTCGLAPERFYMPAQGGVFWNFACDWCFY